MARALNLALVALLVLPACALAGAGSGSSHYSGGGGGGGFSGGGYSSGGGSGGGGSPLIGLLVIAAIFGSIFLFGFLAALRSRRKRAARVAAVRLAAAEAADDDAAFSPDVVLPAAESLFKRAQRAWDQRDRDTLARIVGPDLFKEWVRRLDDFDRKGWHNRVEVMDKPLIEYVGLVNREHDADDRVCVRIEAKMRDYVEDRSGAHLSKDGSGSDETLLREYWTLAKRDGQWTLESIEEDAEGGHNLDAEIIATPWGDTEQLRGEAIAERAAAEAAPVPTAEIADLDFDGPARAAAQDLALADGRFDPDLIEAAVRRAVSAWATAVDGDDAQLEAVASPEAVLALLHPGDPHQRTRLVVRGPRVEQVTISGLDAAARPPALTVELSVKGRRYIEDRDTQAVVAGSRDSETSFRERWTLTLDGPQDWPWRLSRAASATPA